MTDSHPHDAPCDSSAEEVAAACRAAASAAEQLADLDRWPPARRAPLLRAIADALDAHRDELVALADAETALGGPRLAREIARTTGQLRLLAAAAEDPATLGVVVDPAVPDAQPVRRPRLVRALRPIGPVAVFAASNFPFAFSVAGGDTASALAAGCPVVLKAHPGHPRTSARTAALVAGALASAEAPAGTFAVVRGLDAGRALVAHPAIRAAAFTGSQAGGRALFDLAVRRPDPIPFYGELGSVNPVVVTGAAAAARGPQIAAGFVGSVTLGAGQFCTKPGLLLVPRPAQLDAPLLDALARVPAARLLTPGIAGRFEAGSQAVARVAGVERLAWGGDGGPAPAPRLLATDVATLVAEPALREECFGPFALVVRYDDEAELLGALDALPASLAAAVHAEPDDGALARRLCAALARRAGRIVWNDWPTGVTVSPAMHHGGRWPASTSPLHTSVGTAAIDRFQVPVVYQDVPAELLPAAVADEERVHA